MALILDHASDRQKSAMNLSALSHNQLIRHMASHPHDNQAWCEFVRRFQPYLIAVIKRECLKLGYQKGLTKIDDILHDVYLRLLKNECEAFRTFRGEQENAILAFLQTAAVRVVLNHLRYDKAQKRPRMTDAIAHKRAADLFDLFPDKNSEDEANRIVIELAILQCLKRIGKRLRHPERDIRIFVLYLFYGMNAESIAELPEINLSSQSVFRIIADIKANLGNCLNTEE